MKNLLLALVFLVSATAADTPAQYVMWKLDDLRAGPANGVSPGFNRVAEWLGTQKMKAGFGIICNSLVGQDPAYIAWIKAHAIENGGLIEFWHHGWDHSKDIHLDGQTYPREFQGTDLAFQSEHLERSCTLMKTATGLTFHTFGAPFNATDRVTIEALKRLPELQVWLYGPKDVQQPLVLQRSLNLEYETGKVDAAKFLAAYPKARTQPYLVLQGHPAGWSDASFEAFTAIATRLATDGWVFTTPYEYLHSTTGAAGGH